jgi:hypothetical protein
MPTDFLLRLLEWTRLLELISVKREAGGYPGAIEEIEKACLQVLGLSFNLIKHYSPEALVGLMQQSTDASQKSIFLAELLIEYAKINAAEGKTADAIGSNLQAYCLLWESIGILSPEKEAPYRSKLNILAKKLSVFKENPYIQERLSARPEAKPKGIS